MHTRHYVSSMSKGFTHNVSACCIQLTDEYEQDDRYDAKEKEQHTYHNLQYVHTEAASGRKGWGKEGEALIRPRVVPCTHTP